MDCAPRGQWPVALAFGVIVLLAGELSWAQAAAEPAGAEVIIQQNLFHPNRTGPAPKGEPSKPGATAPVPPPRFVLSGVMLDGDRALALVQEPQWTANGVRLMTLGEEVGPYKLTEIRPDRIVLDGPTGRLMVPLEGPKVRPLPPVATPAAPGPPSPATLPPGPRPVPSVTETREKSERGEERKRERKERERERRDRRARAASRRRNPEAVRASRARRASRSQKNRLSERGG